MVKYDFENWYKSQINGKIPKLPRQFNWFSDHSIYVGTVGGVLTVWCKIQVVKVKWYNWNFPDFQSSLELGSGVEAADVGEVFLTF